MSAKTKTHGWVQVTRREPCRICGKDHFCVIKDDGTIAGCMEVKEGSFRTSQTQLGERYDHRLIDEPRPVYVPPVKARRDAPQRNVIADRAVFGVIIKAGAALPDVAQAEFARRFGPIYGPQAVARFGIAYGDATTITAAILDSGRRQEAVAAGVLWRNGELARMLDDHLLIPYIHRGIVCDLRAGGIKGRAETKEMSLPGPYIEREVDGYFFNHDVLDSAPEDGVIHMTGGAYKTMALAMSDLPAVGTRGESELFPAQIAALREAGVRTVVLHIDAEDPKPGQDRSSGRRLGLTKARALDTAGFAVRVAEPPREPGTAKVDPDALLRDMGPRAVRDYALSAPTLAAWLVIIGEASPDAPESVVGELTDLRQRLAESERLQVALMHVQRNKRVRSEKPTLLAAAYLYNSEASRGRIAEDGWLLTTRAALADIGGVSEDAAGEHLERIDQWRGVP